MGKKLTIKQKIEIQEALREHGVGRRPALQTKIIDIVEEKPKRIRGVK